MLINKGTARSWKVNVDIQNTSTKKSISWKPEQLIQYSTEQYHWIADGTNSRPSKDLPPVLKKITSAENITLPPYSLTVIK
jgi:hypothetical protein